MGVRATLLQLYNANAMVNSQQTTGLPAGQLLAASNPSTGSPNVTMAATIPAWVVANMLVYDVTAGKLLGVVSSGAGTTTLVLGANSAFVGSGTSDVLQFGFTPSDLTVGTTAGADVRGLIEVAQLKLTEAIQLINYLTSDVITSGQNATINTVLTTAVTNLS